MHTGAESFGAYLRIPSFNLLSSLASICCIVGCTTPAAVRYIQLNMVPVRFIWFWRSPTFSIFTAALYSTELVDMAQDFLFPGVSFVSLFDWLKPGFSNIFMIPCLFVSRLLIYTTFVVMEIIVFLLGVSSGMKHWRCCVLELSRFSRSCFLTGLVRHRLRSCQKIWALVYLISWKGAEDVWGG
ncbi:hypothetical protein B0J11DRAFT_334137 [Dendryphion nanum]|uniref:Uncharacterized protein n=1 Tax=Dendryphion nanum TaxID=256645 RepID=A0A9P9DN81_9PLEO|nr:hypothetical protein B0J11DRAFT_334137 [Dendryphion nanum]